MIIVVANVEDASNSVTEPAEEDNVVEKCGFNFVFESYSVHNVQIYRALPGHVESMGSQGDVYSCDDRCVGRLANKWLAMAGMVLVLGLVTKEAAVVIAAVWYDAWQWIQYHTFNIKRFTLINSFENMKLPMIYCKEQEGLLVWNTML